jgi:hypothetical protein
MDRPLILSLAKDPVTSAPSSLGDDLLAALVALQEQEVALRSSLVKDSWEDDYHAARRIELAGAAFHVLTSLPLQGPPAAFLAGVCSSLQERQAKLQAATTPPYTGRVHGHLDGLADALKVVDSFLELRLSPPAF